MNKNDLALLKEKKRRDRLKLIFIWSMLALPLLQFLIFFVYVNLSSIIISFQDGAGNFTFLNYKSFFQELFRGNDYNGFEFRDAIIYSFLLGINDVLLVFISTILAYFMYKKIPGKNFFRVVFFLPSIISITIYVLVYKFMLSPESGLAGRLFPDFGWLNDGTLAQKFTIPLYCLWVGTGYNILILGGAMSNIPTEVIENAKLEGVSRRRELFDIIIPLIWPTLMVAFLGSITTVFTLFIQVKLITNGAVGTRTIAYLINNFTEQQKLNYAAAIGICFTLVSIPLVILMKHLLERIGRKWGYK
ncbi:MAG: sugar ABC transporter permease [Bacillales bacterium]|nr:sugar ABC transporter permease [Mollicutes bacterium]MCI7058638.1 sugar ABC transporter permease [Mollicutes bacterium]MCI7213534.1 sugar ABC transporter permease [Bacillales bacterium]MDD7714811.1 sugar ABC transporter permease [Mollicutes bacterium]MDY4935689.1 sugar ABC transporter permease [Candidatus Enteromonas sp.]